MAQSRPLGSIATSEKFRFRAEETRAVADTCQHQETRATLLKVAADYDRMADATVVRDQNSVDRQRKF